MPDDATLPPESSSWEERKLALEERKFDLDAEIRRREMTVQESAGAQARRTWSSGRVTLVCGILSLVSGAIGGGVSAFIQSYGQIRVEINKDNNALKLEQDRLETTLIVKALDSANQDASISALNFLAKAGLIPDYEKKILALVNLNGGNSIPYGRGAKGVEGGALSPDLPSGLTSYSLPTVPSYLGQAGSLLQPPPTLLGSLPSYTLPSVPSYLGQISPTSPIAPWPKDGNNGDSLFKLPANLAVTVPSMITGYNPLSGSGTFQIAPREKWPFPSSGLSSSTPYTSQPLTSSPSPTLSTSPLATPNVGENAK